MYKKIILYYATMVTYNYNVTLKVDHTADIDIDNVIKNYQDLLRRLQKVDHKREFSQAMAIAIRDGIFCAFVYDNNENGLFWHILDPDYYKFRGKNEAGQWVVAFDATYFAQGNNSLFVEGIDGDTSGCWDQVFIDGYKAYQADTTNARWFMLPPERTISMLASMDDEYDLSLPFFSGAFSAILNLLDAEDIMADKTELENYKLLINKIPLIDGETVDDYKISLEMVQAIQDMIDEILPNLIGSVYSPMDVELISFSDVVNNTNDSDAMSKSISNVFNTVGPPQAVVSGGNAVTATAIKQAIANDASLSFNWLARLESNWQYYIEQNMSSDFMFMFHEQTVYYMDDYVQRFKDAATLGVPPMDYMTALGSTPYEAWCKLKFEAALGIREMMIPLKSAYNGASNGDNNGAPTKRDGDLTDSGVATREGDKNDGQNNG